MVLILSIAASEFTRHAYYSLTSASVACLRLNAVEWEPHDTVTKVLREPYRSANVPILPPLYLHHSSQLPDPSCTRARCATIWRPVSFHRRDNRSVSIAPVIVVINRDTHDTLVFSALLFHGGRLPRFGLGNDDSNSVCA